MHVQPYLFFDGRCDEAIAFYRGALDAEVMMRMAFKDHPGTSPPGMIPPGGENKVMHAQIRVGETVILLSDGRCGGKPKFEGSALALYAADEAEADRRFAALADGGQVTMPLAKTFFATRFGMLTDRFGVAWMVLVRE